MSDKMDKRSGSSCEKIFLGVRDYRFSAEKSLEKTLDFERRPMTMMKNTTAKKDGDAEARSISKIGVVYFVKRLLTKKSKQKRFCG